VLIAVFSIASNFVGEARSQQWLLQHRRFKRSAEGTVEQGTEETGNGARKKRAILTAVATKVGTKLATDLLKRGVSMLNSHLDIMFGGVVTNIQEKTRAVSVTIVNESNKKLSFRRVWFDSGKVFHAFNNYEVVPNGGYTVGYFSNTDGSWFTGVGGIAEFQASDGQWWYIGFSHPYAGSVKMACQTYHWRYHDLPQWYESYVNDGYGENNPLYATSYDNHGGFPRITVEIKGQGIKASSDNDNKKDNDNDNDDDDEYDNGAYGEGFYREGDYNRRDTGDGYYRDGDYNRRDNDNDNDDEYYGGYGHYAWRK